jgi:hypothetical protein
VSGRSQASGLVGVEGWLWRIYSVTVDTICDGTECRCVEVSLLEGVRVTESGVEISRLHNWPASGQQSQM